MGVRGSALQVSTRVRYKLWQMGIEKPDWTNWLNRHLPGEKSRNTELLTERLHDDHIDDPYLRSLASLLELEPEELRFGDPLEDQTQTLRENINFLISGLEYGEKGRLAEEVGVNRTTVSRWVGGESAPTSTTQARLAAHFKLPSGTDLAREPLFLNLNPVSHQEKRNWLEERIHALSPETLSDLFPALQRLLAEP